MEANVRNYLRGIFLSNPILSENLDLDTASNEEIAQAFIDDVLAKVKKTASRGAEDVARRANDLVVATASSASDANF